jgi:hypothetical protein
VSLPRPVPLTLWSPDGYRNLAASLDDRKERYLRMIAEQGEERHKAIAKIRGFIADGAITFAPGSNRLRQAAPAEWLKDVQGNSDFLERVRRRTKKPETSMWTDDAAARALSYYPHIEETVNHAMARLALLDRLGVAEFRIPWYTPIVLPADSRGSTRRIVLTHEDFRIKRPNDKPRDFDDHKSLRDILGDLVNAVGDSKLLPQTTFATLKTQLTYWFDHLAVEAQSWHGERRPAATPQRDTTVPKFPGLDLYLPSLLEPYGNLADIEAAYGFPLTASILELSLVLHWPNATAARTLVTLLAWLADLAKRPFRDALQQVANYVSFNGELRRTKERTWDLTLNDPRFRPPPDPAPGSVETDDLGFRILACEEVNTRRIHFRHARDVEVPSGWVWPPCSHEGMYWWNSVLWPHCVQVLLRLDDMADFHSGDLLRFGLLHGLFGGPRDHRVPAYLGACIKASLLQFKNWFDEPAATGHKGGEMTFWSENHQIQFHSSQLLAGTQFPNDVFARSGTDASGGPVTGREHARRGRLRTERWLDRRLAWGFSEWNSPVYYEENMVALFNLVDFAPDERIRTKAAMVLDLLLFDFARFTCRGSFGVTAGRTYFTSKAFGWHQTTGEMIEILFGTRGDHVYVQKGAVALCTSPQYQVPEAVLAIGLDRVLFDHVEPFSDRTRVSPSVEDLRRAGIGLNTPDDPAVWWGLGGYFVTPNLMEATRRMARAHPNLRRTMPMALLWRIEDKFLDPLLGPLVPAITALIFDAAKAMAGDAAARGGLLAAAPFPLNLLGLYSRANRVSLTMESALDMLSTFMNVVADGLEAAWHVVTLQDPPEPSLPLPVVQKTWEAMIEHFNSGNLLSEANLRTFSIGDAMLSSVQDHQAEGVSFQKQSWIASLGCDACVWTNAPLWADRGGSLTAAGVSVLENALLLQGAEALAKSFAEVGTAIFPIADEDDIKDEGLFEGGGSICLPKIVQYLESAIVAYDFGTKHRTYSKTPTQAWFPTQFFDDVQPPALDESWLPERDGGGTWVFGRKGDGYVALYSARRVKWVRDRRFEDDPEGGSIPDRTAFTSTKLRADDGSNIWVCAIGSKARYASFDAFMRAIRGARLEVGGIGSPNQLHCTFEMPAGTTAASGGYRLELFYEDGARVDGQPLAVNDFPRFENKYVAGAKPGRVNWGEKAYRIQQPQLGLWVDHDVAAATRTLGPLQLQPAGRRSQSSTRVETPAWSGPPGAPAVTMRVGRSRRRRFRLDS